MMPTVYNYDISEILDGEPSEDLIAASQDAEPTGAVPAFRDEDGIWQYVEPSRRDFYERHLHHEIITVYVEMDD